MITIDPGENCGWAHFIGSELVNCGLWDLDSMFVPYGAPYLIEDQVIYPRSKSRPRDILKLAKTAGRAAQRCSERHGVPWREIGWVEPRVWKGTLDADVMTVRIIAALDEAERRLYFAEADLVAESYRHNIIDAIGIGLWKLGRLTPLSIARAKGLRGGSGRGRKSIGGKR